MTASKAEAAKETRLNSTDPKDPLSFTAGGSGDKTYADISISSYEAAYFEAYESVLLGEMEKCLPMMLTPLPK